MTDYAAHANYDVVIIMLVVIKMMASDSAVKHVFRLRVGKFSAPEQVERQLFGAGFRWFIGARKNTQSLTHIKENTSWIKCSFCSICVFNIAVFGFFSFYFGLLCHNVCVNCSLIVCNPVFLTKYSVLHINGILFVVLSC